jgi:hypothetical protein
VRATEGDVMTVMSEESKGVVTVTFPAIFRSVRLVAQLQPPTHKCGTKIVRELHPLDDTHKHHVCQDFSKILVKIFLKS